jgi:C4-dicarboxylate transporter DctM subunit
MSDLAHHALLVVALFLILASGVWIGLTLSGVAWIGMQLFSVAPGRRRDGGHDLGLGLQLDADRAAAVHLDGRDPVPHAAVQDMFRGLAPGCRRCRGGCCTQRDRLRDLRGGVRLVGRHLRHHRQDDAARAGARGYPEASRSARWPAPARSGLLIPPSIIMIVYGVAADVSIAQLFIAGVLPGLLLARCSRATSIVWALLNPASAGRPTRRTTLRRSCASRAT